VTDLDAVEAELIASIALAVATAAGAWLVSHLPGPLRDWLTSGTHQRDVQLVLGAMARRAAVLATGGATAATPSADVIAYARETLPEVIAKLSPTEEALRTIALAALAQARAGIVAPVIRPPPDAR
jgi:hypothetical protein